MLYPDCKRGYRCLEAPIPQPIPAQPTGALDREPKQRCAPIKTSKAWRLMALLAMRRGGFRLAPQEQHSLLYQAW